MLVYPNRTGEERTISTDARHIIVSEAPKPKANRRYLYGYLFNSMGGILSNIFYYHKAEADEELPLMITKGFSGHGDEISREECLAQFREKLQMQRRYREGSTLFKTSEEELEALYPAKGLSDSKLDARLKPAGYYFELRDSSERPEYESQLTNAVNGLTEVLGSLSLGPSTSH
jgi:hypothetical protein